MYFLRETLTCKESENKLELSLHVLFSSTQIARAIRGMNIVWVPITTLLRYLSLKELTEHRWAVRHSRKAIDAVEKALLEIPKDPSK